MSILLYDSRLPESVQTGLDHFSRVRFLSDMCKNMSEGRWAGTEEDWDETWGCSQARSYVGLPLGVLSCTQSLGTFQLAPDAK